MLNIGVSNRSAQFVQSRTSIPYTLIPFTGRKGNPTKVEVVHHTHKHQRLVFPCDKVHSNNDSS